MHANLHSLTIRSMFAGCKHCSIACKRNNCPFQPCAGNGCKHVQPQTPSAHFWCPHHNKQPQTTAATSNGCLPTTFCEHRQSSTHRNCLGSSASAACSMPHMSARQAQAAYLHALTHAAPSAQASYLNARPSHKHLTCMHAAPNAQAPYLPAALA